ncbi:hypothetical protein [Pseudoxanthomonas sp. CF125]|nr:hypothetical protein [Pseudoxanthomonas sp. CF125]SDR23054.1 hypothetical protein SAMN05216569_3740 [Pseudoxanthomonas sp. CF125]
MTSALENLVGLGRPLAAEPVVDMIAACEAVAVKLRDAMIRA